MEFAWQSATTEQHEAKGGRTTTHASGETTADALEQRVVAFAEQLGRIAGTFQAKAEGWMNLEALNKQIASVRDSAADLLEQLAGARRRPPGKTRRPRRRGGTKGRSGGVVDAGGYIVSRCRPIPGRQHRGQSGGQNADGNDNGQDEPASAAAVSGRRAHEMMASVP